jgi:RND family efflux transporter MFP subunit
MDVSDHRQTTGSNSLDHPSRTPFQLGAPKPAFSISTAKHLVAAALSTLALFFGGCNRQTESFVPPPVAVTVAKPVEREIVDYVEFIGNTAAVKNVDIRARVSGYLDKVGFAEGAIVKAGEMLFVIDPRPYQAALDQAQANLDQAKAQLDLAKSNFDRSEDLRQRGVISTQDYQTQLATRDQAAASVLSNQAALETAKLNFEFTEVRSPIDGRTSTYSYTVGNLISGGDTTSSGVLTSVVSLDPIYVYYNVEERALLAYQEMIRSGKAPFKEDGKPPIEMQLANETGYPHEGFIDFVDNKVDPSNGTIRVRGAFPNKDGLLRPGLFARVRIPASPKYKALLISDLAVGYDQGQPIVYVVGADNVATAKTVELGALSDGLRVVQSGVAADDRIVVDGIIHLRPGSKVTPQDGNMNDFTGIVRRQVSAAPTESAPKQSGKTETSPGQDPKSGKTN